MKTERGNEVAKCRSRIRKYCTGTGLDLGCGHFKVVPNAIGIDFDSSAKEANIYLDLSKLHALHIFADNSIDYVFSSHTLEHFKDTWDILQEWCRVIKIGGYIILYLPHGDLYPKVGTKGADPSHKVNLFPEDIKSILIELGFKVIKCQTYDNYERWISNEYSFEIVAQKKYINIEEELS